MGDISPGKPFVTEQTSTTLKLRWDIPNVTSKIDHFEVKYQRQGERKWKGLETEDDLNEFRVTGLKSNSLYLFKVRAVFEDGDESSFSKTSDQIGTLGSLAEKVKSSSTKEASDECEFMYKVPIIKTYAKQTGYKIRNCTVLTEKKDPTKLQKTVMVVGATGAGKSTLIDGMVNYILDVAWEEDVRFKLIDLTEGEIEKRQDQSISQTEWITCYSIHWLPGCLIDYHLNIIDTPGFGDTRGIDRDKMLVEQIRSLFSDPGDQGIDTLDAVWFVTQAPMCRLSPTQRYIFDSILAVFGKDIKSNIFVLVTFADGKPPPVFDALREAEVPYERGFTFNNSALYVNPSNNQTGKIFWNMGKKGFNDFFEILNQTEARSLTLTSEVLHTRKMLEEKISIVQKQITDGMQRLSIMREEEEELDRNRRLIADNQDFSYEVSEEQVMKEDLPVGQHTTTCLTCNRTCHENCAFADDNQKMNCVAMSNNYCTVCPKKCIWSDHKNLPYLIYLETRKITKTYEQTKAKYQAAEKDKSKNINVIDKMKTEYNLLMVDNSTLVTEVKGCINRLQEIALRPNPISEIEYIDILIENEEEAKKTGYKDRIKILKELRQMAVNIKDIKEDKFVFTGTFKR